MKPENKQKMQELFHELLQWLTLTGQKIADWATSKSWKWLIVFSIICLIIGGILQEALFSESEVVIANSRHTGRGADIQIDQNGVHISPRKKTPKKEEPPKEEESSEEEDLEEEPETVATLPSAIPAVPPLPPLPPANTVTASGAPGAASMAASNTASASASVMPTSTPGTVNAREAELKAAQEQALRSRQEFENALKEVRQIKREIKKSAEKAAQAATEAEDAAELARTANSEKVVRLQRQNSRWFMNFVVLAIIGILVSKALMGSKKKAEEETEQARAKAEREALQRQVSEAKMQMMQAQVEPHFLFNTLASVEFLIETDPPRAAAMQRSLIKYLRAVLPQMRENALQINLGREIDLVRAYLDLLKMRMEERLNVEFTFDESLRNAEFPPMMLQMLVENAIKHGLEVKPEGGTLKIACSLENQQLQVRVIDDGVGFGAVKSDSTGLGLNSIRERLKLLHGNQARLLIEPNSPSGVCATIELPYKLAQNPAQA
ncbi:histidine kinase [Massilia sp. W12]|uniref:sensor histidine kinase n=1 Tax=Massilia sp. W12 TaxID=3126507 RepID=UPI0030CAA752